MPRAPLFRHVSFPPLPFLISLSDQALGALLNFTVNLWMAREGLPNSYGVYALWLAVAWITGTAQSTLITCHLSGLTALDGEERATAERFLLTIQILFVLAAFLATALVMAILGQHHSKFHAAGAIVFVPMFLVYQYTRALFFAHHRADFATALTATSLFLFIVAASTCSLAGDTPTPDIGLLLAGGSYGTAAFTWLLTRTKGQRPLLRWREMRPHLHYLGSSGWILLGAASAELTSRMFNFVGAWRYGALALAELTATQVVIRPAWMLSAAWASISLPQLSRMWAHRDRHPFMTTIVAGLALPLVGSILWTGGIALSWPELSHLLYKGHYQQNSTLVLLWGANVILGGLSAVGTITLLSMRQYRILALTDVAAALTTTSCMVLIAMNSHPAMVIVGTVAGQTVQCFFMIHVVRRILSAPRKDT
ncbi:lipopolysaccharide biosynthesis protein [Gluconacetobacter sacchari]|uniref:O-antigen/teichoic acid export membrane protein n=2 Tax=Gluconacetobacter sacchari TaxID=92759 RepID=A0A7W4IA03_9PROT|nr:hypothetical protein [Gluconacetobacter sacchari]MBB2159006.1 hypothetical protein [Gluconacetobacter sacchari]GBQ31447.1 hypothetical protein AA12717_3769 [Gluconacetobacter sacchari DSM 12717]